MRRAGLEHRPKRIWIIGAGKFGRISVEALGHGRGNARITVIDNDPSQLQHLAGLGVTARQADGIDFLNRHLGLEDAPDWIVPVIPLHVAAEWIRLRLGAAGPVQRLPVPQSVIDSLPHPMRGRCLEIYTSLADFLCPQDCPQPPDHCTFTGKPRPYNLADRLASIRSVAWRSVVVVSHQLAPGVGALSPPELFQALSQAGAETSRCLIGTACKCHGVVSALGFAPE